MFGEVFMKNKYPCAGFTLAELLAVVIIVSLLSALGVGYYKRAVEQARFAEGLSAASAVVEAVNQSYFDQQIDGDTPTTQPKIATLDISLANANISDDKPYSFILPYFEVKVETNGNVRAYRGSATSYTYYIDIQPSFASSNKDEISCGADGTGIKNASSGKTFCESMGYTQNCPEGDYVCTK